MIHFYINLITNYNSGESKITNEMNKVRYAFTNKSLIDGLSYYDCSSLCFEILYKKIIDPTFDEKNFEIYPLF